MKVDKRDKDGEVFEKVVFDLMLNKYSDDKELKTNQQMV